MNGCFIMIGTCGVTTATIPAELFLHFIGWRSIFMSWDHSASFVQHYYSRPFPKQTARSAPDRPGGSNLDEYF
jgi:hypothetical protein